MVPAAIQVAVTAPINSKILNTGKDFWMLISPMPIKVLMENPLQQKAMIRITRETDSGQAMKYPFKTLTNNTIKQKNKRNNEFIYSSSIRLTNRRGAKNTE